MARDGTHSGKARSFGLLGPVVTLLFASVAVMALRRRKPEPLPPLPRLALPLAKPALVIVAAAPTIRPRRRMPRFLSGTLTGVTTGIALGITAAVLVTIASPDVRSAVIVGAGFDRPPMPGGEYVARVMAQAMNPNLAYADETGVAALLATTEPVVEDALVVTPGAQELEDNAPLIFGVLAVLTVLMWSVIMLGLSGGGSKAVSAGVE